MAAYSKKLLPSEEQALIYDYEIEEWRVRDLMIIYRISERTVYRILAAYKVPLHGNKRSKGYKRKQSLRRRKQPKKLKPCGTNAAYQRHRRKLEYPCTACLAAHAANVKKAKNRKKRAYGRRKRAA